MPAPRRERRELPRGSPATPPPVRRSRSTTAAAKNGRPPVTLEPLPSSETRPTVDVSSRRSSVRHPPTPPSAPIAAPNAGHAAAGVPLTRASSSRSGGRLHQHHHQPPQRSQHAAAAPPSQQQQQQQQQAFASSPVEFVASVSFRDDEPFDTCCDSPTNFGSGQSMALTPSASAPAFLFAVTPPRAEDIDVGHVVNVVRSRRASATASAVSSAFASPAEDPLAPAFTAPGSRRPSFSSLGGGGPCSQPGSRRSSLAAGGGLGTPRGSGGSRLEARNQSAAEAHLALEALVARRTAERNPRSVAARRWAESIIHALAAQRWLRRLPTAVEAHARRTRALRVLRDVFVPCWHRHRRWRRRNAELVIARFILRLAARLRIRKRRIAADRIVAFLSHKRSQFRNCCLALRERVVRVQRAWRRFAVRRAAQVELHMRWLRNEADPARSLEVEYWRRAGKRSGFVSGKSSGSGTTAAGGASGGSSSNGSSSTATTWYGTAVDPSAAPRLPRPILERRLLVAIGRASRRYHADMLAWETRGTFTSRGHETGASAAELRRIASSGTFFAGTGGAPLIHLAAPSAGSFAGSGSSGHFPASPLDRSASSGAFHHHHGGMSPNADPPHAIDGDAMPSVRVSASTCSSGNFVYTSGSAFSDPALPLSQRTSRSRSPPASGRSSHLQQASSAGSAARLSAPAPGGNYSATHHRSPSKPLPAWASTAASGPKRTALPAGGTTGSPAAAAEAAPAPAPAAMVMSATTFASLSQLSKLRQPKYSPWLPRAAMFTLLDECCHVAAALQRDPRWTAHLDS